MLGMADNFRDTVSKQGIQMRFEMLSSYAIEEVERAARKILLTRKYTKMPTIAEFIEAIDGGPSSAEDKALVEAHKIIAHLRVYGAQFPPGMADPVSKYLMTSRWPYRSWAAQIMESEIKWWIREFCGAYRAHQGANLQVEAPPSVVKSLVSSIGRQIDEPEPEYVSANSSNLAEYRVQKRKAYARTDQEKEEHVKKIAEQRRQINREAAAANGRKEM